MNLTISVHSLSNVKWWVDVSYNTHDDCKGHIGAIMNLGEGAVISIYNKQKLDVKY